MSNRTTPAMLFDPINAINAVMAAPMSPIKSNYGPGAVTWNVGHYMLDKDNTGYQLQRVSEVNGAVKCPISEQRLTAAQMRRELLAYLAGLVDGLGRDVPRGPQS